MKKKKKRYVFQGVSNALTHDDNTSCHFLKLSVVEYYLGVVITHRRLPRIVLILRLKVIFKLTKNYRIITL